MLFRNPISVGMSGFDFSQQLEHTCPQNLTSLQVRVALKRMQHLLVSYLFRTKLDLLQTFKLIKTNLLGFSDDKILPQTNIDI